MSDGFENDDTMFSVKIPPWHGIGTVLEDNPTPAEAVELAGMTDKVEGRPVYVGVPMPHDDSDEEEGSDDEDDDEDGEEPMVDGHTWVQGYQAITRVSDGKVYAILKDSYHIFQFSEAFEWITPLVENGMLKLETAGTLGDGRRGWILAAVVGAEEEVRPGDLVKQNVLFATSHDGTMSVWNGTCATRVVCSNTLRMAMDEGTLNRIRHSDNMHVRLDVARDVLAANIDTFRSRIGLARLMADRKVTADLLVGYVRAVFKSETEDQLQKRIDTIMPLFEGGRGNGQGSLWDLYNAVTEWLNYNRGKSQDGRLESLWFGEGAKISDRAWGSAVKPIGEIVDDGDGEEG